MGFENEKNKSVDSEKLRLAESFVQLNHANILTKNPERLSPTQADSESNRTLLTEETQASGEDFRTWFNSPDGKAIMRDYVSNHTIEQIGHFADMEKLEELYLQYRNRTLH
ncbi:MAG: hypothetical protein NUW00_02685 [Candidatus Kaiserbacteria bacterium]|nr:hypothetical protein [Candidatus Kaiserbacteria bacterium]